MLDKLTDGIDPFLADLLWFGVFLPIINQIRWVFKTKESRDALHSALRSGVDLVSDALVRIVLANPIGYRVDQLAGKVADYAFDSVPDAIKFLLSKPWFMRLFGQKALAPDEQRAWLENMAVAKLKARAAEIIERMKPDELAEALRQAKVEGVVDAKPTGPRPGY